MQADGREGRGKAHGARFINRIVCCVLSSLSGVPKLPFCSGKRRLIAMHTAHRCISLTSTNPPYAQFIPTLSYAIKKKDEIERVAKANR